MANKELLISLGLDATSYTQSVKKVKDEMKELDSEWKLASASSDNFEKSLDGIAQKQDYLAKRIELASQASDIYSNQLKKVQGLLAEQVESYEKLSEKLKQAKDNQKAFDEGVKGAKDYSEQIKTLQQQYDKATKSISSYQRQILDVQKEYNNSQASIQVMNKELVATEETLKHLGADRSLESLIKVTEEIDHKFSVAREEVGKFEESVNGLATKQQLLNEKNEVTYQLLGELGNEIGKSEGAIQDYKVQIEGLTRELDELLKQQNSMRFGDEGYDEIKTKVQDTRAEISRLTSALEFNEERTVGLNDAYKKAELSLAQIAKESQATSASLKELTKNVGFESLVEQTDKFANKELNLLNEKLKVANADFEQTKVVATNLEGTFDGLSEKQNHYNNILSILSEKQRIYNDSIQSTESKVKELTASFNNLDKELQVREALLKNPTNINNWQAEKEEMDAVEAEYKKVNNELMEYKQHLKQLVESSEANNSEMLKTEAILINVDAKFKELGKIKPFTALSEQVKNFSITMGERLTESINAVNNKLQNFRDSSIGFSKGLESIRLEQSLINESLGLAKEKLSEYQKSVANTSETLEKLKAKEISLREDIIKTREAMQLAEGNEKDNKVSELNRLEAEYKELGKDIGEYTSKLKNEKSIEAETRNSIVKQTAELNKLEIQYQKTAKESYSHASQLKSANEQLKSSMSVLDAQFEEAQSKVKNFGLRLRDLATQEEYVKLKQSALKQTMENLQKQLAYEGKSLAEAKEKAKQLEDGLESLRIKADQMTDKTGEDFLKLKEDIARSQESLMQERENVEKLQSSFNNLQVELSQTSAKFNDLNRSAKSLPADYVRNFGSAISDAGSKVRGAGYSLMGLSLASAVMEKSIVKSGTEYQNTLSNIQAVSDASVSDMEQISQRCTDLANNSTFTAQQIAQGYVFLAQAGYKVGDANKVIGDTLKIAQAGEMSLQEATSLTTDSIASLGYSTDEASEKMNSYLNIVAQTANSTNSDVKDIMQSFIGVGGQLKNLHIDMATGASMLGVLANQGIKAQQAGNSLNSILIDMTKTSGQSSKAMKELGVSVFDAKGQIRPIEDVIKDLSKALSKLNPEKRVQLINMIGGKTQAKTLQKLLQGMTTDTGDFTESYKELKQEIEKAPSADGIGALNQMSKTMTDNFKGDVDRVKAKLENFKNEIFYAMLPQLEASMKRAGALLDKVMDKFNKLSPAGKAMVGKILTLTAIISPLLIALGTIGVVLGTLTKGFAVLLSPLTSVIKTMSEFRKIAKDAMQISDASKLTKALSKIGSVAKITFKGLKRIYGGLKTGVSWIIETAIPTVIDAVIGLCTTIASAFEGLAITLGVSTGGLAIAIGAVVAVVAVAVYEIVTHWDKIKSYFSNWWEWVKTLPAKFMDGLHNFENNLANWWSNLKDKIKNFPKFLEETFVNAIKQAWQEVLKILGLIAGTIIGDIMQIISTIKGMISGYILEFKGIFDIIIGIFTLNGSRIKKGFKEFFQGMGKVFKSLFKGAISIIAGTIENIALMFGVNLRKPFKDFATFCKTWFDKIKSVIVTKIKSILKSCKDVFNNWIAWLKTLPSKFMNWLHNLGDKIKSAFSNWWEWVKTIPSKVVGVLKDIGVKIAGFFIFCGAKLAEAWDGITGWFSNLISNVTNWCSTLVNNPTLALQELASAVSSILDSIHSFIAGIISKIASSVANFFSNLLSNCASAMAQLSSNISEKCGEVVDWFKSIPAKVANVGREIVDSIWSGVKNSWSSFSGWVSQAIHNVTHPFSGAVIINEKTMPNLHKESRHLGFAQFAVIPTQTTKPKTAKIGAVTGVQPLGFYSIADQMKQMISDTFNINNFKTNGGFYQPQKMSQNIVIENKSDNKDLIKLLMEQNQMLLSIISNSIQVDVNIDGRQVAKASAKYMSNELDQIKRRNLRLGGSF